MLVRSHNKMASKKKEVIVVSDSDESSHIKEKSIDKNAKTTTQSKMILRPTKEIVVSKSDEEEEGGKYAYLPEKTGKENAKDVCDECAKFTSGNPKGIVYLLRLVPYNMTPYFKIGFMVTKKTKHKREFHDRIREINSEYDCRIGYPGTETNIIVVALRKGLAPQLEASVKEGLENFRVSVKNKNGGNFTELYKLSFDVYDKFCTLAGITDETKKSGKAWESELYNFCPDTHKDSWDDEPL